MIFFMLLQYWTSFILYFFLIIQVLYWSYLVFILLIVSWNLPQSRHSTLCNCILNCWLLLWFALREFSHFLFTILVQIGGFKNNISKSSFSWVADSEILTRNVSYAGGGWRRGLCQKDWEGEKIKKGKSNYYNMRKLIRN